MSGLHPTPTRLALLRAVRDKRVERRAATAPGGFWEYYDALLPADDGGRPQRVTARMRELRRAHLVQSGPVSHRRTWVWQLTPAGERVVGAAGGAS